MSGTKSFTYINSCNPFNHSVKGSKLSLFVGEQTEVRIGYLPHPSYLQGRPRAHLVEQGEQLLEDNMRDK